MCKHRLDTDGLRQVAPAWMQLQTRGRQEKFPRQLQDWGLTLGRNLNLELELVVWRGPRLEVGLGRA